MPKRKRTKSRAAARQPLVGLAGRINAAHRKCKQSLQAGAQYAVEAGRLLIEAKAKVPPNGWLRWLEQHCEFPERMAQRYMRLARELPEALRADPTRVSDLSQRAALELLADRDREEAGRPAPWSDGRERLEWKAVPVSSPQTAEPVAQTVKIYDAPAARSPADLLTAPPAAAPVLDTTAVLPSPTRRPLPEEEHRQLAEEFLRWECRARDLVRKFAGHYPESDAPYSTQEVRAMRHVAEAV